MRIRVPTLGGRGDIAEYADDHMQSSKHEVRRVGSHREYRSDRLGRIAELIAHIDDESLIERLVATLGALTPIDCSLALAFRREARPLLLFDDTARTWRENKVSEYLSAAYLLDPFYIAASDGIAPGVYRLGELAPDGFSDSAYYRAYYERSHVEEEICHLVPLNGRVTIAVSLERHNGSERFSDADIERHRSAAPIVRALLRTHWRLMGRVGSAPAPDAKSAVGASIQRAYRSFGSSVLTPRECDVVRLLLGGHSTRSLAQRLGISPGTAKVHRERIYAKLDISLQSELFHLFIDSVSSLPEHADGDPLAHYVRQRS